MTKTAYNRGGLSIIETVIAIVIIALAVLGTTSLRYQSTLDTRRAEVATTASRLTLMLTETWRGRQGSKTFDPVALLGADIQIQAGDGPAQPTGFTLLGKYLVRLSNINFYATLSYNNLTPSLRALNVTVAWQQQGIKDSDFDDSDKTCTLTAYVEQ
jgi:hypothetical protein